MHKTVICPHCCKKYSNKGIDTHIKRTHTKEGFAGSTGRNKSYKDPDYIKKLKISSAAYQETKYGPFRDYEVNCHACNAMIIVKERIKNFPQKEKYFCNRSCANSRVKTEEIKKKISKKLIDWNHKNPNKSVKETIEISCIQCGISFFKKRATSKFCSISCSRIYRTNESRKHRDSLVNYRSDCSFKFNLNDYPDEFDFTLVERYGWYKAKNRGNNLNGVSRDHIISVRYGFDNNIDPKIISHPANCQLLRHNDNVSKNTKCHLTLDELLLKIDSWNQKYLPL